MKHILIVDDNKVNLVMAKQTLGKKYKVSLVISGKQALQFLEKKVTDLILLDVNMPEMDGMETLRKIREREELNNIPIIFLTAEAEGSLEAECLERGAVDFISKPFEARIMLSRIARTLELEDLRKDLECMVKQKTKEVEAVTLQAIIAISNIVDAKDHFTKGHSVRVAQYSKEIGKRLGWEEEALRQLYYTALLHDIGKIGVPDNLLSKPTRLTDAEYHIIKKHTVMGGKILEDISMIAEAANGAKSHHERYDGQGYGEGLLGEEIPLIARIIGIADAYDAMTTNRAYRNRLSTEHVKEELRQGRATQFDPKLVDIMLTMIEEGLNLEENEMEEFQDSFPGESNQLLQKVIVEYTKGIVAESKKDALTGLWNRIYIEEIVNEYLKNPDCRGTLFMMDMDNFKIINDTYGHMMGDALLIKFAEILKQFTCEKDTISRIGGDEFVIFFPGLCKETEIEEKANQLLIELRKHLVKPDNSGRTSVSIGVAVSTESDNQFSKLYEKADKLLYIVKQKGKNDFHMNAFEKPKCVKLKTRELSADWIRLRSTIEEKKKMNGLFEGEYDRFQRILQLISEYVKNTHQIVQIISITLSDFNGNTLNPELLEPAMVMLKKLIVQKLRAGDISTVYSSAQLLIILMDATYENGLIVAKRISEAFLKTMEGSAVEIHYEIQEVYNK